jgi:hypothetical protein
LLIPVLLLCLMLVGTVPASAYSPPPDHTSGQIGHYDFRDYAYGSHTGNIDCNYRTLSSGQRRIKEFVLRAPRIWWPDTNSENTNQHGTVGWRYRLQQTTDPDDDPWTTVFKSSVQKRTAHEDHPGFSDGDKAPFDTRTLTWSSSKTVYYRVKATVYWYRSNGSVKGQVDHWYSTYDASYGPNPALGYCNNKWAPL